METDLTKDNENIDDIIAEEKIRTLFQPIVSLTDAGIIGYEALSRGPKGSRLEQPNMLFGAASEHNRLWELEYLCRLKAIERSKEISKAKKIFINVDPKVILDERYKIGFTKEFLAVHSINPTNIIFEITERTCIEDYKGFLKVINNYVEQGYKIAIDDTGAGYSGLRMLAEVHPQYIKIDMELVRDIDKKTINQALIKALRDFAYSTNMHLIAEGIETVNELNTLMDLDIEYGQGYLFQKPSEELKELDENIRELIRSKQESKNKNLQYTVNTIPIGEIARLDTPVYSSTKGSTVDKIFYNTPSIYGIPVVEDGVPVGLIMRNYFYSQLATQYGVAVFMNRPIGLLMNKNPLIVDYNTSLARVSNIAVGRRDEDLYDYIIITKDEKYYGVTTVKNLLERTTQLELNKAKHSNPLTGLPGNVIIENRISSIIKSGRPSYLIYYDLDNFKAYNDTYGFEKGDNIILFTSKLIQECLAEFDWNSSFVGHVGGDDFISVLDGEHAEEHCRLLIERFDRNIPSFYSEKDRNNKYIISRNRAGSEEKFPLITISIAVLRYDGCSSLSSIELSEALSGIKKKCKQQWQSCYIIE